MKIHGVYHYTTQCKHLILTYERIFFLLFSLFFGDRVSLHSLGQPGNTLASLSARITGMCHYTWSFFFFLIRVYVALAIWNALVGHSGLELT